MYIAFPRDVHHWRHSQRKGQSFTWSDACRAAFEKLKLAFIHYITCVGFFFWTRRNQLDWKRMHSDFVSAGVLSQYSADGTSLFSPLWPFFSVRSILRHECNYEIYEFSWGPTIKFTPKRPYCRGFRLQKSHRISRRRSQLSCLVWRMKMKTIS